MNNKFKIFAFMSAMVGCVVATFSFVTNEENLFKAPATVEYELVFDKTTKPDKNPLPTLTITEKENNYYDGAIGYMPVTTKLGYNDLKFFYEGGFENTSGFITLGFNGEFGNSYLKNSVNHGQINGLTRLNVTYTGAPLIVNYGYQSEMADREFRVTSVPLMSNDDYLFDGNHPQYFSIMSDAIGITEIESIKLYYSCNQDEQAFPKKSFYTSGYQVGAVKKGVFTGTANNLREAHRLLDRACAEHYQMAQITFAFDNQESEYDFINFRRVFSHVWPVSVNNPESSYQTGLNKTNTFLIIYAGDNTVNYDSMMLPGFDPDDLSLYTHKHVAQINTITHKQNISIPLTNVNMAIRKNYATANNLFRDPNYDNFPINNIAETFDVYNSEDLWWAVLNGYKPNFPLENSKAEWIYNEAKHILNSIIYDGMNDYEKARAIYEWIITENDYDYDALHSPRPIEENVCFFLEGVFERRRGVCDSFSKTFVLLGKIEGLDVERGCGFTHPTPESKEAPSGHAWGYFRYPGEEKYRLVCPTWGNRLIRLEEYSRNVKMVSYDAFMAKRSYFVDNGSNFDFIDGNQNEELLSLDAWDKSVYTLDAIPGNSVYDFQIDTVQELAFILDQGFKACGDQNFVFQFDSRINIAQAEVTTMLKNIGFNSATFNSYFTDVTIGVNDFIFMQKGFEG